jgi:hypothetical protein
MKTAIKSRKNTEAKNATQSSEESEEKSTLQSAQTEANESESSQSGERTKTKNASTGSQSLSAPEFDRRFDKGESIFDLGMKAKDATHPGWETQRVNLDLPKAFLEKLDRAAAERGIARQALIKSWLYDRLESQSKVMEAAQEIAKRYRNDLRELAKS